MLDSEFYVVGSWYNFYCEWFARLIDGGFKNLLFLLSSGFILS